MSAIALVAARLQALHGLVDDGGSVDLQGALGRLAVGAEDREAVAARVLVDRDLWQRLIDHVVVGETHLMRHPRQLERVVAHVGARLAADATPMVWCAGCSSGEEPWSLALLIERTLGGAALDRVQLVATDASAAAITRARAGHYSRWSLRGCPAWVRDVVGDPPHIPARLAARVDFDVDDIVARARRFNAGTLDVVCFRNVALYLTDAHREAFFDAVAVALRADGLLVLGPADPRPVHGFVVDRSDDDRCVYRRHDATADRGDRARPTPSPFPRRRSTRRRPVADTAAGTADVLDTRLPDAALDVDAALAAATADADAGRLVEARARVDAVLGRLGGADPRCGRAWRLRGVTLLDEDADAASEALRRAVFFAPDDAAARALYGIALHRAGRVASGRSQLEQPRRALGMGGDDDELRAVIDATLADGGSR
jgi:chemotaxis protein methyltransferase CheR